MSNGMAALVTVDHVWAGYAREAILRDVSLQVSQGEFVGIIGPNGGGKTTLLRVILGLLAPRQGLARTLGEEPMRMREARKKIGYIPQVNALNWNFPVTVRDVVMMGRYGRIGLRNPGAADHAAVEAALERAGMSELANRRINELSGGQRQRTLVARALAQDLELLVMDEPTNGLDPAVVEQLEEIYVGINRDGATLLTVTHDLQMVPRFHRVVVINRTILAEGTPAEILDAQRLGQTFGRQLHRQGHRQQEAQV
ncbi:MAG: metal ABC transporter ATP-binding protein [Deinococcus sp.]|nr:metal ABC transporter ATP-binding protein [Deinococcus sp.]